jgi:hypothetical protein
MPSQSEASDGIYFDRVVRSRPVTAFVTTVVTAVVGNYEVQLQVGSFQALEP